MTDGKALAMRDHQRYHHGNLRRDLLRVACNEIAQHGAEAVSFASLARLAGVSQPAPYVISPTEARYLRPSPPGDLTS